jgi:hypothetical protein
MKVVEIDSRSEHDLPADTVTRDEAASGSSGPFIPLAFRVRRDVFYICSARWPGLAGKALLLKSAGRRSGGVRNIPPPDHPVWRRLVSGEVPFQPSFLGACMFLARARTDLQQPGGGTDIGLYTGQLSVLYVQNMDCGSVQRDLVKVRMNEISAVAPDCTGWFKRASPRPSPAD